ncbi:hypothetical protein JCM21531_1600 [Acetivibrio straminisolvens JCM 21531]|uniref:DUF3048 domain-containing protein n=2 Tax=Acetivibrio straminisolvens TaxID=253314 RepID=W4V3Y8_9FIRM|nr:hypothetical protein JCM21531_1600 [Acetivibrio straminisolvens JCM 21531]
MPVFWGQKTELIGPVRSARHYFLDYAMEHDAIYVHIGWSLWLWRIYRSWALTI